MGHLGSIWVLFGVRLESIWGPYLGHLLGLILGLLILGAGGQLGNLGDGREKKWAPSPSGPQLNWEVGPRHFGIF